MPRFTASAWYTRPGLGGTAYIEGDPGTISAAKAHPDGGLVLRDRLSWHAELLAARLWAVGVWECAYMTMITVSTVGYAEVLPDFAHVPAPGCSQYSSSC